MPFAFLMTEIMKRYERGRDWTPEVPLTKKQRRCQHKRDKFPEEISLSAQGHIGHWVCPFCGASFTKLLKENEK